MIAKARGARSVRQVFQQNCSSAFLGKPCKTLRLQRVSAGEQPSTLSTHPPGLRLCLLGIVSRRAKCQNLRKHRDRK